MPVLLGAVADDVTGATDLCNTLVKGGMRTVQLLGLPPDGLMLGEVDAVTVALKSRTAPVAEAVAESLAACRWLREAGARQVLFKYCSTFDSTDAGNIGPVADALMDELAAEIAVVCPAFPETGRTIYKGNLFVGDVPLAESSMRQHPLTPMTDSSLVRVLGRQTPRQIGLVAYEVVRRGREAVAGRLAALHSEGCRYAVCDAIEDEHLRVLGAACAKHRLITGGSGIALGLPENFRREGLLPAPGTAAELPSVAGPEVVIAGSCSVATLGQIAEFARRRPALKLDLERLGDAGQVDQALGWALARADDGPVLVYASAPPEEVGRVQDRLGREEAGRLVEATLAAVARGLFEGGVRRFVVAGGETSGAVTQAVGVRGLRIGAQIDPGVPACVSLGDDPVALALKSGNFGAADFFTKAFEVMP